MDEYLYLVSADYTENGFEVLCFIHPYNFVSSYRESQASSERHTMAW
jgi:hypothetical protein